ncbi:MAG: cytochrome c [Gemmatimonadaceae bacterium]|nr:cytochrome c [Gemmatimonadaceae bacterium]
MRRWRTRVLVPMAAAMAMAMAAVPYHGGWVIVTMHEWPEALEAGKATTLTFSMRQHGEELLAGREPVLQLKAPGLLGSREKLRTQRTEQPGVYRATFTPEEAGELRVSVDTDFYGWTAPMLPLAVRANGAVTNGSSATATLAGAAHGPLSRGQQLFVAKGCAGCHAKTDDNALEEIRVVQVGPNLTGRTYPAGWVERKILDPASQRSVGISANATMPQLEVTAPEAAAIAAYVNARQIAAGSARH